MSNPPEVPPASGRDEARSANLGEPERDVERGDRLPKARPNLDERERGISERRRPMGPPLREPDASPPAAERLDRAADEPPVDPMEPDAEEDR